MQHYVKHVQAQAYLTCSSPNQHYGSRQPEAQIFLLLLYKMRKMRLMPINDTGETTLALF